MTVTGWNALRRELDALADSGLRLPVWVRDDDATEPTAQLDRLSALAETAGLPVHLAIVPARARPELAPWLSGGTFRGVVHGWAHENHAPPDHKRSEFGTPRPAAEQEAAAGLARLRTLYGDLVHPMFVPPWNRIHPDLILRLAGAGYTALSTFGPRPQPSAAPGVVAINTHVDPVDWRGGRGLADPDAVLDHLVRNLRDRRAGTADRDEPLGLLTHHLAMDADTWAFCARLLDDLCAGPVDFFDIAIAGSPA